MNEHSRPVINLPPEQQVILAKCFHPLGGFTEFTKAKVEQSIPGLFEETVLKFSDRLAIKDGSKTFSYEQLNKVANRIARAIVKRFENGSEPLAVILENGAETIIGALGVLKTGRILVLIDPSLAHDHMTYLIDDSQAKGIVTNARYAPRVEKIGSSGALPVINIDNLELNLPVDNLKLNISGRTIAQIRYTSGSTGLPKGVARSHRNILHGTFLRINTGHLCPHDRLLYSGALTAGASLEEILSTLLTGAAFYPLDIKEKGFDGLEEFLTREKIRVIRSLPSTFRHLVDSLGGGKKFPDVRLITLTGETASRRLLDIYKKHFSADSVLLNRFGSSEAGIFRLYYMDHQTEILENTIPAGYAVDDKRVFLLDEKGDEVGAGEIGEIAVSSRYLTLGYWRDPEGSGAKFLSDPEGGDDRTYLTGDLGRFLPNGCLVHLGRKDFLVKIRGYRVSLLEVESALLNHPAVKEAVVVAWDNDAGEKYLAAYLVFHKDRSQTTTDLLKFLRGRLPVYALPATFIILETLPSYNGKVDRRALRRPERIRPNLAQPYEPATNEIEQNLIQIWEEVLDVRPIGTHDNFFDLGGHSLAATRIVSQVINKFQLEIPLPSLFQSPTVEQMAMVIMESQAKILGEQGLQRILSELESLSDEAAKKALDWPGHATQHK